MTVTVTLDDLPTGAVGILEELDVRVETATRLMELGFIPGVSVLAVRSAPGGDPRVFRVDGCDIALRREIARHLHLRCQT